MKEKSNRNNLTTYDGTITTQIGEETFIGAYSISGLEEPTSNIKSHDHSNKNGHHLDDEWIKGFQEWVESQQKTEDIGSIIEEFKGIHSSTENVKKCDCWMSKGRNTEWGHATWCKAYIK